MGAVRRRWDSDETFAGSGDSDGVERMSRWRWGNRRTERREEENEERLIFARRSGTRRTWVARREGGRVGRRKQGTRKKSTKEAHLRCPDSAGLLYRSGSCQRGKSEAGK